MMNSNFPGVERRSHERFTLEPLNPASFIGPNDLALQDITEAILHLHTVCSNHPVHGPDLRCLTPEEIARFTLQGGMYFDADPKLEPNEPLRGRICACVEPLGIWSSHMVCKFGRLAPRDEFIMRKYLDGMKLPHFQMTFLVIRTWKGLSITLRRIVGETRFGPFVTYPETELKEKIPELWNLYFEGGRKKSDQRDLCIRFPVGCSLDPSRLPNGLTSTQKDAILQRSVQIPVEAEVQGLREYLNRLTEAKRRWGFQHPDLSDLRSF